MKQINIEVVNECKTTINKLDSPQERAEMSYIRIGSTETSIGTIDLSITAHLQGMTDLVFVREKIDGDYIGVAELEDLQTIPNYQASGCLKYRVDSIDLTRSSLKDANLTIIEILKNLSDLKKRFDVQSKNRKAHLLNGDFQV